MVKQRTYCDYSLYKEHFWRNKKGVTRVSSQQQVKKSAPIFSQVQAINGISVFHYMWYFSPYICLLFGQHPFCPLQLPYKLSLNRMSLKFLSPHSSQTHHDSKINTTQILTGSVPAGSISWWHLKMLNQTLLERVFYPCKMHIILEFVLPHWVFSSVWWLVLRKTNQVVHQMIAQAVSCCPLEDTQYHSGNALLGCCYRFHKQRNPWEVSTYFKSKRKKSVTPPKYFQK